VIQRCANDLHERIPLSTNAPPSSTTTRTWSPTAIFAVAVLGVGLFSVMDAVMKALVLALGAYTTLLWRSLAGTFISGAIYFARPRKPLARATIKVHMLRAAVSTAMAILFFWGLARMPMAQAVALTFIAPLLSLFLSAVMLGERIRRITVIASSIAFVGVSVILFGQWQSDLGPVALQGGIAVLCSALLYAFNIVLMRRQALIADPLEVAFSQSVLVTIILACGGPFFADLPAMSHVPLLVFAALLAVVSLLLMAWAYKRSDASHLSTSEYTSFVWAALFGWIFFAERVTVITLIGAALIVLGCMLAARYRPAGAVPEIEATA
jgi:S-adenosylmethionine uptake transporter